MKKTQQKVDRTALWAEKYPVLAAYPKTVDLPAYTAPLDTPLRQLRRAYGYSEQDAFLVWKDIGASLWQEKQN